MHHQLKCGLAKHVANYRGRLATITATGLMVGSEAWHWSVSFPLVKCRGEVTTFDNENRREPQRTLTDSFVRWIESESADDTTTREERSGEALADCGSSSASVRCPHHHLPPSSSSRPPKWWLPGRGQEAKNACAQQPTSMKGQRTRSRVGLS